MGGRDEKSSVRRNRSLSESIKGLFKPVGIGIGGSNGEANNNANGPSNGNKQNSAQENTKAQQPARPSEMPQLGTKKNSGRLGNIATNKEAELSSSRGAPIQAPASPLQSPVLQRPHHGLPNVSKLSITPLSPPGSDRDSIASEESHPRSKKGSSGDEGEMPDQRKDPRNNQKMQENKLHTPQMSSESQESGTLIDSILENDESDEHIHSKEHSKDQAQSGPYVNGRRSRANSHVGRSGSLKRNDSLSSNNVQGNKDYLRARNRADTFSASSLPKFSEIESKCVLQVENFKVYENGFHEHNLKVSSLVTDGNDNLSSSDIAKQKSSFSLSGMFKHHKEDSKQLENALSLIPASRLSLYQRIDRSRSQAVEDEQNGIVGIMENGFQADDEQDESKPKDKATPRIVNTNAAVGSEELKLINTLSEKIHSALNGESLKIEGQKKDIPKFYEQYGKPVGLIGHGAYGVVKVCSRPKTPKDIAPFATYSSGKKLFFAVKELRPKANDQIDRFSTRITSEFIIGHSLSHCHKKGTKVSPNILTIFDLMETNDAFVEVMEFCPSGDLYSILTRKSKNGTALHPLEADCFMKQLLHGVQYMHNHGVAHCDLKPENILFYPNGLLKICDFGTSCVFQTAWEKHVHFQTGTMGSEPYVAPEEFITDNEYDPRLTDCWSCGIVYCTMVLDHYLWKIALRDEDVLYDSFYEEMKEHKQFYVFEEMRHVNNEISRLRRAALYSILQIDPKRRITIDSLLQSPWMKHTRCCVFY
ncbi:hypothetical protein HG535_0B04650 [Zygotorulaspora mrakii]|uniref:non-specific serine/threonine protein kinase n=1 Tax=Zygotorulaspora mrakii TaxID=42260 RepID=A0A7H9AYZ0_ZYGMR|nr:uncharacterized protein HG535_0B04650 [Zygotorulaspora mrakii]QLG71423.1 hypothetical protein HG535_0B04650 [Zygotorulaspora mrakii]